MVKNYVKIFWIGCSIFVCVLLCTFFILNMKVSNFLADNIEKEILNRKNNIPFIILLDKKQNDTNLICAVPRYYSLHKLKNKLPINNLDYYSLFLIDLFYENEQGWWFLSLQNEGKIVLYRMPYKFVLNQKGLFCFTPNAKLNYLNKRGIFFHLSVEE